MEKSHTYKIGVEMPEKDHQHLSKFGSIGNCNKNLWSSRFLLVCVIFTGVVVVSVSFSLLADRILELNQSSANAPQPKSSPAEEFIDHAIPTHIASTERTSTPNATFGVTLPSTASTTPLPKPAYVISQTKVNWFEALQECKEMGMELLSIETRSEQVWISNYISEVAPNDDIWTSGTNLYSADFASFYWASTGQRMGFTFWHVGTPNSPESQHCVEITSSIDAPTSGQLRWNDYGCHIKSKFICEIGTGEKLV